MYARHDGQIYMIIGGDSSHVTLMHPNAVGAGVVNVALNGPPALIPGMLTIERSKADFFKDEPVVPMPPIPFTAGLQVGSRCRWGTSLAEWVVLSIAGDTAKIRQCSGWNQAMIFDAPVSELIVLSDRKNDRLKVA